jgi:hypothetical protein
MGIAHRHQLLPQLTGYAVVTGVRKEDGGRVQQGDGEGGDRGGLKEGRALRKHGRRWLSSAGWRASIFNP